MSDCIRFTSFIFMVRFFDDRELYYGINLTHGINCWRIFETYIKQLL